MFHDFPYTNFHELNLDFLMRQCGAGLGLRLAIEGDYLRLVNTNNEVVSQIKVHYSDTALSDTNGKPIKTYICDAQASGTALIFVNGQNEVTTITVPYAEKAKYDINSHEIEDYVYNVQVAGDNLRVTKGDQTIADITVPYAVQATEDEDGKTISTYAAELSVDGNNVVLRDAKGRVLESITVPYATEAYHADSADMAAEAAHADEADSALDADHADLADLATVATDCTNAIQSISISGNNVIFTTYAGQVTPITIPYATKAQKDDAGNTIKTTYVASVSQNASTGEISFFDATGNVITSLVPTASKATYDSYDNEIADYIKNIVVSSNSDYVTVTHGDGAVDTIQINYSTHALKDTNENVIKNTYCRLLTMETDTQTGDPVLVGWNGDNPTAEIFRLRVHAKAGAGRIIFNTTNSTTVPYSWNTGSRAVTAKDEEGNPLTPAEVKAKIEAGAAIQVIATCTSSDPNLAGSYVPNDVRLNYGWNVNEQKPTFDGIDCYFMSNTTDDTYFDEGRRLFINLNTINVMGTVYKVSAKKIDDLSNINLSYLSSGDVLAYDGTNWVNSARLLSSLSDVSDRSPSNGDILVYNGFYNKWEASAVESSALVAYITVTTPLYDMNNNVSQSCTLDVSIDEVHNAFAAGKTVVVVDYGRGAIATIVGMGTNASDGAIAMGGSAQSGIRYFTLNIDSGTIGTISCKIVQ